MFALISISTPATVPPERKAKKVMNPVQAHPASGVVVPHHHAAEGHYAPETASKAGADVHVTAGNEAHHASGGGADAAGNPVLEGHDQTKGRWFQYLKTKQFWVTLLLGQGMYLFFCPPSLSLFLSRIRSTRNVY